MEAHEESSMAVLRLFGREPTVEDLRCVGRWAYAAAWLAEDRTTARELARARLARAARAATSAAMAAGRGEAERFMLVGALARLDDALESGEGPLGLAAERAVDEAAAELAQDGAALRAATARERAAFAPRVALESFASAMLDVGQDRHVLMRETATALDEALIGVRSPCPALRTLRLFLHATLTVESYDAPGHSLVPPAGEHDLLARLGTWLAADIALAARRATAYESAWATAARSQGDALSRTVAGLTSGAMLSKGVVEALVDDPWALPLTLAMTSEPAHASALLDCGEAAQVAERARAGQEAAQWAAQARRVEDLESGLGISVVASEETREGHRGMASVADLDLFSAWDAAQAAEEARSALRQAAERSVAVETSSRRDAVRRAKGTLQALREAYEAAVEAAHAGAAVPEAETADLASAEAGAHRGCLFGFGTGCSVMAAYAVAALVIGTEGIVGQVAPLVVGVAALPVAAAIVLQVALGIRRAATTAEAERRRARAEAEVVRLRAAADRTHGNSLAQGREALEAAETSLTALERRLVSGIAAS